MSVPDTMLPYLFKGKTTSALDWASTVRANNSNIKIVAAKKLDLIVPMKLVLSFLFYVYGLKTSERQWYFVLDLELFMYLIQIEK